MAGESLIGFKSYDQGREKFQGETLNIVWLDEEPDEDIYTEALTRTNATGGMVYMTFTPLKGMTGTVKRFLIDKPEGTCVTTMTIEDAEHYTPEQRAAIIASYPAHEREARTKGIPTLGSGRIFAIADEAISIAPFEIPHHWPQICGIDFGWDHPSAATRLAWPCSPALPGPASCTARQAPRLSLCHVAGRHAARPKGANPPTA